MKAFLFNNTSCSQISWQQLYENQISPNHMLSTQKANLQSNKSSKLLDLVQQDNINKM